jgi:hypothetical protein
MDLLTKALVFVKRLWRYVYNTTLELLRRIVPEPIKRIAWKILHWGERKVIVQNQEILLHILNEEQVEKDYRATIIFPPSLDWNIQLFQRPQQLALALAKQGALVFYIMPRYDPQQQPFQLFRERLYLCYVHVDSFEKLPNPLIYLLTWNSVYASRFAHPKIIYDYVDNIDAFYGEKDKICKGHQYLLKNADFVLATARKLVDEARLMHALMPYFHQWGGL